MGTILWSVSLFHHHVLFHHCFVQRPSNFSTIHCICINVSDVLCSRTAIRTNDNEDGEIQSFKNPAAHSSDIKWHLEFGHFSFLDPPFCVSSHLSNLQALSLEYVHVIYPVVLLAMTYMCIELHARSFKPID